MSDHFRERYFERRQIKEAIAFAEAGGVAIHRNFDYYHGSTIRGMVREKPFLHIIGLRPMLEQWGRQHGLRPEWIQPEKRRKVAHYDVFGPPAEALIVRLKPSPENPTVEVERFRRGKRKANPSSGSLSGNDAPD